MSILESKIFRTKDFGAGCGELFYNDAFASGYQEVMLSELKKSGRLEDVYKIRILVYVGDENDKANNDEEEAGGDLCD